MSYNIDVKVRDDHLEVRETHTCMSASRHSGRLQKTVKAPGASTTLRSGLYLWDGRGSRYRSSTEIWESRDHRPPSGTVSGFW